MSTNQADDASVTEEEAHTNPLLACVAEKGDSELKDFLIDFTGNRLEPEDETVTVHMIAEVLAAEFPEFVFAFAEENFLRGYQLGLDDAYKTIDGKPEEVVPLTD